MFSYRMQWFCEEWTRLEVTQEVENEDEAASVDEDVEAKGENSNCRRNGETIQSIQELKPASLDLLPHVRINLSPETPIATLKYMVARSNSQLQYNKTELRKSEELMTQALIEFYRKLQVLKGYR